MRFFSAPNLTGLIPVLCAILMATALSGQIYNDAIQITSQDFPKGILFDVNKEALQTFTKSKSSSLQLSLPYKNKTELHLELEPFEIHAIGFSVTEKSDKGERTVGYKPGKYYRGYILGEPESRAVIAIQGDEISGVVLNGTNTLNIGKLKDRDQHILYDTRTLEVENFKCGTLPDYTSLVNTQEEKQKVTGCNSVVEIYMECDYQMYLNFSSNTTSVTNYVNTLFVEVAALYAIENITVQLSQVTVWSSNDGYSSGTVGLTDFSTALNNSGFNGDLAHLLTNDTGSNGGVAYVDQLCGSFPYGYSDILNTTHPVPTYSWDVQVVTHELGHNFGSNHTHDCVWGPSNNQQIDDCGSQVLGGGSCYDPSSPILPSGGGTIMSYCHLNSVGIDLNNGFGIEPGTLIRAKHSTCMCDNSTCGSALLITESGSFVAKPASGGGASSSQATNADWFEFTPSINGTIDISSCYEGVDTRLFLHTGDCANLSIVGSGDDDCVSAGTNTYAAEILNFVVTPGTTYYIEWDDRWSTAEFNWNFTFTESSAPVPTITCPSFYAGENSCSAADYDPVITGEVVGSAGSTISYNDVLTVTTCSVFIDRTWTATLSSGTAASCVQPIDLDDTMAPIIQSCPSNITVVSADDCLATVTWIAPTALDACTTSVVVSSTHTPGSSFAIGTQPVSYTFTDACSNSSTCNFSVIVEDGCTVLDPCDGDNINITGTLVQDSYRAEISLESNGIIQTGATTLFTAGQSLDLTPGFEVSQGAVLESNIDDCQN